MACSNNLINSDTEEATSSITNDIENPSMMRTIDNKKMGIGKRLVNDIRTIVQKNRNKLIRKLRTPSHNYFRFGTAIKPEEDMNQIINELGVDLIHSVLETVEAIHNEVKSVRPSEDDPNYKSKLDVYLSLLQYTRQLLNKLTAAFDETLIDYRMYVDQLWNDIQSTTDCQKFEALVQQFQAASDKLFDNVVLNDLDPHLSVIEFKFYVIKQLNDDQ